MSDCSFLIPVALTNCSVIPLSLSAISHRGLILNWDILDLVSISVLMFFLVAINQNSEYIT
jgi:hypothetical protein